MVMHARKQPRLNDGYHDGPESHIYQYPSRSNHVENYNSQISPVKSHDPSPRRQSPRYRGNKHNERRVKSERAMSPSTRKLNHQASIGSKSSQHSDNVRHSSQNFDRNARHDSARDQKLQMLKSAKRVHGDWSEHVSSSGKRYFYNCKTEVSQWERPKDWPDQAISAPSSKPDDKLKDRSRHIIAASHKSTNNDRMQHSLSANERSRYSSDSHNGNRTDHWSSCADHRTNLDQQTSMDHLINPEHASSSEYKIAHASDRHSSSLSKYSVLTSKSVDMSTRINRTSVWLQNVTSDAPSDNTPPLDLDDYDMTTKSRERRDSSRSGDIHYDDDSPDTDDMDISPGHTPNTGNLSSVAVIPSTHEKTPHIPSVISSLPHLIHKLSDGSQATNQNLTQQAIQTLRKLQEAISKQVSQSSVNQSTPPVGQPHTSKSDMPSDVTTSSYHTNCVSASGKGIDDRRTEPQSQSNQHEGSPASGPAVTSVLTNAPIRPPSFSFTPSLTNYHNDTLISHVEGWPAEHVERQVVKAVEESIIGSQQTNRVCSELKNARSLVRISEIQSTLHEQRMLFLSQVVRELETSKPRTWFT